jgi:hypothetical protein
MQLVGTEISFKDSTWKTQKTLRWVLRREIVMTGGGQSWPRSCPAVEYDTISVKSLILPPER